MSTPSDDVAFGILKALLIVVVFLGVLYALAQHGM